MTRVPLPLPQTQMCVVDGCIRQALPGHSMCRRDLDAFARACRADDIADVKRKRAR